jgi:hypothetical protein
MAATTPGGQQLQGKWLRPDGGAALCGGLREDAMNSTVEGFGAMYAPKNAALS